MTADCLTEEDIAQLLEAGLRTNAEQHLARCARCRRLVSAALRLRENEGAAANERERIGRYVIEREIGAGATGVVYAASDTELDRPLALKLLRPLSGDGDLARHEQRLRREAQAMARMAHPNIVRVYEIGRAEDQLFIAMELIDGGNLARWSAARTRSEREVVEVFIAAGRGLIAAHEHDLVHRDFKPDNVLVARDGRVYIADFGMVSSETGASPAALSSAIASSAGFLGTPAYMAPEALGGEVGSARADQFSFVVALYEAIYGERPYQASDLTSLRDEMWAGRPTPPPGRSASRWLEQVIARGLSVEPSRRFPSMRELVHTLERGIASPAMTEGLAGPVFMLAR